MFLNSESEFPEMIPFFDIIPRAFADTITVKSNVLWQMLHDL
jgi:hypothetical protein